MEAGALGAEIVLSGKVTGARSRVEKFNRGYIKHNGEPAEEIVDHGVGTAVVQLGTIGVQVKIIPPGAELPDDFEVYEDQQVEDYISDDDGEGVEELLAGEPEDDEAEEDEPETAASEGDSDVDEEVVEEAAEEFEDPDLPDEADVEEELEDLEADVEEELDEDTEAEAEELMDEMESADDESADEEGDDE
jgi:small subunit ribosomal protein S3